MEGGETHWKVVLRKWALIFSATFWDGFGALGPGAWGWGKADNPMTAAECVAQLAEQLFISQRRGVQFPGVSLWSCRYFASPTPLSQLLGLKATTNLYKIHVCHYLKKSVLIFLRRESEHRK